MVNLSLKLLFIYKALNTIMVIPWGYILAFIIGGNLEIYLIEGEKVF
jgi:hypothetical protein